MFKQYLKCYYKDVLFVAVTIVMIIRITLLECYNMSNSLIYHDYIFTYLFIAVSVGALLLSIRVQYKEFRKACTKCQKDYELQQAKIAYDNLKEKYLESEITIIGSKEDIERIKDKTI